MFQGTNFNPLSPHGERRVETVTRMACNGISIHSPRMGRDRADFIGLLLATTFQSTLPAWGETLLPYSPMDGVEFQSTLPAWGETGFRGAGCRRRPYFNPLSPHGERPNVGGCSGRGRDFNPLSPHGERHRVQKILSHHHRFQSTLPAWGETSPPRRSRRP